MLKEINHYYTKFEPFPLFHFDIPDCLIFSFSRWPYICMISSDSITDTLFNDTLIIDIYPIRYLGSEALTSGAHSFFNEYHAHIVYYIGHHRLKKNTD